ncbi:hypothetical protein ACFL06_01025 [Patescibacteria group bacterium]
MQLFKLAAILGVIVFAILAVLLVLDLVGSEDVKEVLTKVLVIIGVLTAASIVISLIVKPKQEK